MTLDTLAQRPVTVLTDANVNTTKCVGFHYIRFY